MVKKHLSHIDSSGKAKMVDVGEKKVTRRTAIAMAEVHLQPETLLIIRQGLAKKGDVLSVAQVAGIMAAKQTSNLIPLCHPLPLEDVQVELSIDDAMPGILVTAHVKTNAKTGVEMEALTSVSIAALTVYDMVKAVEKKASIHNIRLIEKHGGRSGDFYNE
jgi:cyclic pyranopterin phosphate synthase